MAMSRGTVMLILKRMQTFVLPELILCLSRYYCIVNTRVIIAFINSSLYSCVMYRQVKGMVTLHLFIESPLQVHCIKFQRKTHPYSSLVHS